MSRKARKIRQLRDPVRLHDGASEISGTIVHPGAGRENAAPLAAYLQQLIHQTTHTLARFFLEIDANFKQFQAASRLRAAAKQRVDAQRACYEEGRITIGRYLDAVSQYETAVATEAQYKAMYNSSIVALEEAKGTLLDHDNIVVAQGPHPKTASNRAAAPKTDHDAKAAALVETQGTKAIAQPACGDQKSVASCSEAQAEPRSQVKTWSFSISIGNSDPIKIQGTVSVNEPDQPVPAPPARPAP